MKIFLQSKTIQAVVTLAIVSIIWSVVTFVDYRIASALDDPKMQRKIAMMARPEMIIDHKGTVLIDSGAMEYIADFSVKPSTQAANLAGAITITPKRYMAHPPLVTAVDAGLLHANPERGKKLDWIINFWYGSWSMDGTNRLRVEIMDR